MGKPAARITDMHACPMVTALVPHVGGPVAMGSPDVLTGALPQARVGDAAVCVGPPDVIALGSTGVFVNKRPAARMGDLTAHGGAVVLGLPTVLIGDAGGGATPTASAAAPGDLAGRDGAGPSGAASGGAGPGGTGDSGGVGQAGGQAALGFVEAGAQAAALKTAAAVGAPFCRLCFG